MKPKPRKRPSGAAQLKASGKTGVLLGLTQEQNELIERAAALEGRRRSNFIIVYAERAARKILDDTQTKETT